MVGVVVASGNIPASTSCDNSVSGCARGDLEEEVLDLGAYLVRLLVLVIIIVLIVNSHRGVLDVVGGQRFALALRLGGTAMRGGVLQREAGVVFGRHDEEGCCSVIDSGIGVATRR